MNQILTGDCLEILPTLPAGSVHLVVTSPPYPGQKGNEMTVEGWLGWMGLVIDQLARVLTADGVLALNVMFKRRRGWFDGRLFSGTCSLLAAAGLHLVDVYPWVKTNPTPNGRISRHDIPGWEPVFLAAKSPDYAFYPVRRPYRRKSLRADGRVKTGLDRGPGSAERHPRGARQRNVIVAPNASCERGRPLAAGISFPRQIPERFVLQHTRPGDVVLDPFAGAGTTCHVAGEHGRVWIGIEQDPAEAEMARQWLTAAQEVIP